MKRKTKLLIASLLILIFMLIVPFITVNLSDTGGDMGLFMLFFFIANPFVVIILSVMAGTDLRHLWFLPFAASLIFPPLFWITIKDVVWDLFFYSALYVGVGLSTMIGTFLGIKIVNNNKKR